MKYTNVLRTMAGLAAIPLLLTAPNLGAMPLNDTGITICGDATSGNNSPCLATDPEGQDADYGRDAASAAGALVKVGAGEAGFDYTKIANNGAVLPATAALGSGPGDWACTRDNVTGLVWEVKTDDGGLRDKDWTYTWFNSDPTRNGGSVGDWGTHTCGSMSSYWNQCNTEHFVAAVNGVGLCGLRDWRMPSVEELNSIVHRGRTDPAVEAGYFPNTTSSYFWSGSPNAYFLGDAWYVHFYVGYAEHHPRGANYSVRLVRGGQ